MKNRIIAMLLAAGLSGPGFAATEADVENSFNPYKNGFPTVPGVTPGTMINKGNVDQFKEVLGTAIYKLIKDGRFEILLAHVADKGAGMVFLRVLTSYFHLQEKKRVLVEG